MSVLSLNGPNLEGSGSTCVPGGHTGSRPTASGGMRLEDRPGGMRPARPLAAAMRSLTPEAATACCDGPAVRTCDIPAGRMRCGSRSGPSCLAVSRPGTHCTMLAPSRAPFGSISVTARALCIADQALGSEPPSAKGPELTVGTVPFLRGSARAESRAGAAFLRTRRWPFLRLPSCRWRVGAAWRGSANPLTRHTLCRADACSEATPLRRRPRQTGS